MSDIIPKTFKRLPSGLLEGVSYIYKPDGSIDYRAMIKPEYLAVQSEKKEEVEARFNKKVKDLDLSTLPDYYLIILLGGIKDLLRIRGYKSLTNRVDYVSEQKAVVTTTIEFIGNFETGGEPVIYSDTASASVYSVSGVFQLHLEAIAANRSLVRAVRNALGINIVGKDEFDERANKAYLSSGGAALLAAKAPAPEVPESTGFAPFNVLSNRCKELTISFEKLKEAAAAYKAELVSDPAQWEDFSSLKDHRTDCYTLLTKINESQIKKVKKTAA